MSDPRVCHHGGLRRSCEACDLAERLDTALRLLRAVLDEGSAWDDYNECRYCGNRYAQKHAAGCEWIAAHAFIESEPLTRAGAQTP